CKKSDLAVTKAKPNDPHSRMEQQANEFAAELLMPARAVASFVRDNGEADLSHILELARRHDVSREAAARRYIPRICDPAAIIFSNGGVVRYARLNEFFPKLSVCRGDQVPPQSVSALSTADIGEVTGCVEVAAYTWLQRPAGVALFEQTLAQQNGFRMTLLTAEIEEVEDEWEAPSF
ncbi:MAG: ImmA/IrrE family metallo-endopeptidase, partial [Pseudomonadota bacterium]